MPSTFSIRKWGELGELATGVHKCLLSQVLRSLTLPARLSAFRGVRTGLDATTVSIAMPGPPVTRHAPPFTLHAFRKLLR